jgi:transposase-like protein
MKRNQKYDRDRMFSLVEEYLLGGITQKELSVREGIKVGTFKYWHRKYQSAQSDLEPSKKSTKKCKDRDFIPITVSEVAPIAPSKLEFYYPNGVRLELSVVLNPQGLSTVKALVLCLG